MRWQHLGFGLLILLGLAGLLRPGPAGHEASLAGVPVTVFEPAGPPRGTILCVHSVFQGRDTALPAARAMAEGGFRGVAVHLAPGEDFYTYVEQLEQIGLSFEPPRHLLGHSMGADLVLNLAQRPGFGKVVAFGFPVEPGTENFLAGAGAWDQVHSLNELQQAGPVVLSPYCDHSGETLDPYLLGRAIAFFGGSGRPWPLNRVLAQGLLVVGVAGLLIGLGRGWLPLVVGLALAGLVSGSELVWALAMGTAIAQVVVSANPPPGWLARALGWLGLVASAVALSWAIHCYQSVLEQPAALLGLPLAVVSFALTTFVKLTAPLGAAIPVGLGLLEWRRPGWLFEAAGRRLTRLTQKVRQFHFSVERPTPAQIGTLLLCLGGAAWAWRNVVRAGYALSAGQVLHIVMSFVVLLGLPLLVVVLAVRARLRDSD
ncbi:MAG: hypothetical protein AB7S38_09215 [Vulcanimicrobiota bacterium]